jgi:hypothetical protein
LPLAIWIAGSIIPQLSDIAKTLNITGLIISMLVNALVTGLIVFRISKVFRELNPISDVIGRTKVRSVIFIIIESGVALFSIQLARVVVTIVSTDAANDAYPLIVCIHQILTVTILLLPFILISADDMDLARV